MDMQNQSISDLKRKNEFSNKIMDMQNQSISDLKRKIEFSNKITKNIMDMPTDDDEPEEGEEPWEGEEEETWDLQRKEGMQEKIDRLSFNNDKLTKELEESYKQMDTLSNPMAISEFFYKQEEEINIAIGILKERLDGVRQIGKNFRNVFKIKDEDRSSKRSKIQ
jgi:hypothetical protein